MFFVYRIENGNFQWKLEIIKTKLFMEEMRKKFRENFLKGNHNEWP